MKKILFIIIGVLVAIVFAGTIVFLITKAQKRPVLYKTVTPVMDSIEKVTVANGYIIPRKELNVKSQIRGIIERIYVEPGDLVTKGTVLAKIIPAPDQVSLNEANNRLEKARLAYADAKEEKVNQESLFNQKLINAFEYKPYQLKFDNAALDLQAAENNIRLLKEGAAKQAVGEDSTLVYAPADGTVLEVPVKEGDTVMETGTAAGTILAVIADMKALVFEGKIDESEVGKLHSGLELELTIGAIENQTFKATLEYIAPKGMLENQGAIQFMFRAALVPQNKAVIRAGYSANARIILDKRVDVLTISENVILFDKEQNSYVEVETAPQQFTRRDIILGLSDGIKAEILSGLTLADKVKGAVL